MINKRFSSFALSTLSFFLLASPVLAGGGPVSLQAFPQKPFDQTKAFILQADIYTTESCDQIQPTFSLSDTADGDSIMPFPPPDDGTYITRHYNTGQPDFIWKTICTTYAQVKSGIAKQRLAKVSVVVNGKTETREIPVSFGDDSASKELQSFGRVNNYDNVPHPDIQGEKYLGGVKRAVSLQWQKIPWATKYALFAADSEDIRNKTHVYSLLTTTEDTKATINLQAFSKFYLAVMPCRTNEPCDTWKENVYNLVYIDQMRNISESSTVVPSVVVTISQQPPEDVAISLAPPSETEAKIEELNQKVASLEAKLEKSQKKQSILEQTVQNLINLLQSVFPFLK